MKKELLDFKMLSIDEQLAELKREKDQVIRMFDSQISELEGEKTSVKGVKDEVSFEEREDKIREDLTRSALEARTPRMPQNIDQMIPVEPEAQGLPVVNPEG